MFTFADPNAGTDITINVGGTTLTGVDAGNYTLTIPATALADILQRGLTITASGGSKLEGDPDPELSFSVTGEGLVAGDALTGALARDAGESPGDYAITPGTLMAGPNYIIDFIGGLFTILPDVVPGADFSLSAIETTRLPVVEQTSTLEFDFDTVCPGDKELCDLK